MVSRRGGTVLRPIRPWTATVHALLRHLERTGFDGAPRVIGSGVDGDGREVVSFIEGGFVHPGPWSEPAFAHLGRLLRDLHAATESFPRPPDAAWRPWHGRRLGRAGHGIGHCDAAPWNIVAREGLPSALIDWETAGPVDPVYELAQMCWLNAQLHDDDIAELQGLPSLGARARQLRSIVDGYGLPRAERVGFVDKMIELAVHDAAAQAVEGRVTPEGGDTDILWGISWRTRSAAWMLRHRSALEAALGSRR